jgi:hypothetical protein
MSKASLILESLLNEAEGIGSKTFCAKLEAMVNSMIKTIGRGQLIIQYYSELGKTHETVYVDYFNVPENKHGGANGQNNRFAFLVDNFGKTEDAPPPTGKVKFEMRINSYKDLPKPKGKTGTPEVILKYVFELIKTFAAVEPNLR